MNTVQISNKPITFATLKIGDVFRRDRNDSRRLYMKIKTVSEHGVNAVSLSGDELLTCDYNMLVFRAAGNFVERGAENGGGEFITQ